MFIDADGSNAFYKEFEMNAANAAPNSATWTLCLNAPYDDGGYENSSRVFGAQGFDMQLLAASWTDGTLNAPSRPSTRWTAEIRFPLAQLATNTSAAVPPRDGDIWRINFSRVEWGVIVVDGRYIKRPHCITCPNPGSSAEDNWCGHLKMRLQCTCRSAGACCIFRRLSRLCRPLLPAILNGPFVH